MDSVTQATLGAAVGEAVGGREAGYRAPIWGALFGTLPDLDTLVNPFLTEAQALTFHRGLSHSLLFVLVVSIVAALGLRRLHRDTPLSGPRWLYLVGAVLLTHIGLDCLTSYGTQIFWPFSRQPVLLGTIFVIDPLYTLPLAGGFLVSLRWSPVDRRRRWANFAGLILSSAYLLLTIGNKLFVYHVFSQALDSGQPTVERVHTSPTPFNNLLWRGVAETEDDFLIGFYSVLDDGRSIDFRHVPKQHDLLGDLADAPAVQHFRRFSRGYFIVRKTANGTLTVHDLRFGRNDVGLTENGKYIFSFRLVDSKKEGKVELDPAQPPIRLSERLLRRFFARIQGRTQSLSDSEPGVDATRR